MGGTLELVDDPKLQFYPRRWSKRSILISLRFDGSPQMVPGIFLRQCLPSWIFWNPMQAIKIDRRARITTTTFFGHYNAYVGQTPDRTRQVAQGG